MTYFKIENVDFSAYVNELKVTKEANYNAQVNAAGNTVVDYINSKRVITVGFIPMNETAMQALLTALGTLAVNVSIINPATNTIESIGCIAPSCAVDYYTIQDGRILFNPFTIEFVEL